MTNIGNAAKPMGTNPSSPEAIAVKAIYFNGQVPLPGNGGAENVSIPTEPHPSRARYELAYLPVMRHHRVTYYFPGGVNAAQSPRTVYIPEACVKMWEPA